MANEIKMNFKAWEGSEEFTLFRGGTTMPRVGEFVHLPYPFSAVLNRPVKASWRDGLYRVTQITHQFTHSRGQVVDIDLVLTN